MFKKTLVLILTSLVSFNTMALSVEAIAYCETIREFSTATMFLRQTGIPKEEMKVNVREDIPEGTALMILNEAYNWTHVNTGYREHTAKIFGTNMANMCYKVSLELNL